MDREYQIDRLQRSEFDLLIIGGGATGAGCALDAASRGLHAALVERDDFASGTSSRSTKLVHGGVRYLEQAVKKLDRGQLKLVRDALHERSTLLRLAPHLVRPLPILTPLYNRLDVPYYRTGLSLYDKLAGKHTGFPPSHFVNKKEALQRFPMLKAEGLRGAVVYYDGQFDDARMGVSLATTAEEWGAVVANHVEVIGLRKRAGKLNGAILRDRLSAKEWEVSAKCIINATGPFGDSIRLMDDPGASPLLEASAGVHIVLHPRFSPPGTGLLVPKTEDGRVLFLLPWLGHTLVGTTDNPARIEADPRPTAEEIEYILRQLKKYFALDVDHKEILSAWSGLRPLVADPRAADTARLSRDHVVNVSASGLVTIAGGKWTTYRRMAADAVASAVKVGGLTCEHESRTSTIAIVGGKNWRPEGLAILDKEFGLPEDVARHLHHAYGDRAGRVAEIARDGLSARLAQAHPYLEAEVIYGARFELARTPIDLLARRTRLSFLDHRAALAALPRVSELLGRTLGWDAAKVAREEALARAALE